jgi:hypothetical protein
MFHLNEKPSPPRYGGRVTCGHAVDSSATGDHARTFGVDDVIEFFQKLDRFNVSRAAVLIRNPFASLRE